MSTIADGANSEIVPASITVTGTTADVVTLRISGEISPDAATILAEAFDRVAAAGEAIVVDMTGVTILSLEAAAVLATLARRCGDEHRILRVHTSLAVRRKLAPTGLGTVIPLAEP